MDEEGKDQEVAQSEELGNFPGLEVLGTLEGPSAPQGTHRVSLSFVLFFWNRDVEMVTQKHCLVALVVNGTPSYLLSLVGTELWKGSGIMPMGGSDLINYSPALHFLWEF